VVLSITNSVYPFSLYKVCPHEMTKGCAIVQ